MGKMVLVSFRNGGKDTEAEGGAGGAVWKAQLS